MRPRSFGPSSIPTNLSLLEQNEQLQTTPSPHPLILQEQTLVEQRFKFLIGLSRIPHKGEPLTLPKLESLSPSEMFPGIIQIISNVMGRR